ncbi:MAG: response regulator transcription factor [Chloroflexi bacterium]|nr:response regulator transcription factor [Chloroflexota bacterium]
MKNKILIVDDENNVRFFLERLLQLDGYEVTAVDSGEAAMSRIAVEEYDLALLDVMMPGLDGMEVLNALHEQWPHTIVIMLTAHASLETAVSALRQGAHDYLFKPCDADALRQSVREGLVKRQQKVQQHILLEQIEQNLVSSLDKLRSTATGGMLAPSPSASEPEETEVRFLQRGGLIMDLVQRVVTVNGRLVELSPIESDLIAHLVRESPRIISPQELVLQVQGYESESWEASEVIRAHIYRIRQKIKAVSEQTDIIRTVRSVGYTITE